MHRLLLYLFIPIFILSACKKAGKGQEESESDTFVSVILVKPLGIIENRIEIKEGTYIPLYGGKDKNIKVNGFKIDATPVTNANYLTFVKANPQWQRSQVKKIFADGNYLNHWLNDTTLGDGMLPNSPVTNVSWFAAKAYCQSLNCRLPTLDEWEYVAMADEATYDARENESYNQYILNWYEKQKTYKNEIGKTPKNVWGVYDLHGLVWEWVDDFNGVLVGGESRGNAQQDKNLFCASGALGASDLMNYAAFMRYAFRGSLKANYNIQNLGFRTVSKEETKEK